VFDARGEIDPNQIYIQIIRPGVVKLPNEFDPEVIGRFGHLTVLMPPPEVIAATKLVRGSEVDIEDVVWWVKQRGLDAAGIETVIDKMTNPYDRETAAENIVYVQLVMARDWTRAEADETCMWRPWMSFCGARWRPLPGTAIGSYCAKWPVWPTRTHPGSWP